MNRQYQNLWIVLFILGSLLSACGVTVQVPAPQTPEEYVERAGYELKGLIATTSQLFPKGCEIEGSCDAAKKADAKSELSKAAAALRAAITAIEVKDGVATQNSLVLINQSLGLLRKLLESYEKTQ